jgi:hypothetical protein
MVVSSDFGHLGPVERFDAGIQGYKFVVLLYVLKIIMYDLFLRRLQVEISLQIISSQNECLIYVL